MTDTTEAPLTTFQRKVAERRAREQAERQALIGPHSPEDIPDDPYNKSEEDLAMDRAIDSIDILEAYSKFCGKMVPDARKSNTEGIMVSCPKPDHADKNPSAWVNTDKQVWFCGGCQEGGDKYDIAAYGLGFPVPGYKEGSAFHDLRKRMAESFGYSYIKPPGAPTPILVPPSETIKVVSEPEAQSNGQVVEIYGDDDEDENITFPSIAWRDIVPVDSFLDSWMKATCIDDVPEEYHFWHGMLALGLAAGRDVSLVDQKPVYSNLFVCILGHSGSGKSKSRSYLGNLLSQALPFDRSAPASKGVKQIPTPASAEVLIHNFTAPIYDDPTAPKVITGFAPVRGIVDFAELSSLTGRAARLGNVIKPTLMEFYDCNGVISTASMTHGTKEAHDPFCSVLTTTQPLAIRRLLNRDDADSGFLNRWIFAAGPYKTRMAIGGLKVEIDPAVDLLKSINGWAGSKPVISWDSDVITAVQRFFEQKLWPDRDRDSSGLLTRMDLLFKKLCLLFAINEKKRSVDMSIFTAVVNMYDYIVDCYAIPAARIGSTLQSELRSEILRHAERLTIATGRGISLNDLNKRLKRKDYPIDLIVKTLKYMCELGELELETSGATVGRPTVRYRYVG